MKKQRKGGPKGISTTANRQSKVTILGQLCSNDDKRVDTIAALTSHISDLCTEFLLDFARLRNPLQAMVDSSVIWLRPDGMIELDRTSLGERAKETEEFCFIEVFSSLDDATPDSHFHRRIPDLEGSYVGKDFGAELKLYAPWTYIVPTMEDFDGCVGMSREPSQDEVPFRIEPDLKSSVSTMIKSQLYKEDLNSRIFHWLLRGKGPACLEKLSIHGLKDAAIEVPKLVAAYGAANFSTLLRDRTKQEIAARAAA